MAVLIPWPSRQQRRDAIGRAREQKERSRLGAEHAAAVAGDIERMRRENHFGQLIAEQLMRGYGGNGER
jgi:hypothetical protein